MESKERKNNEARMIAKKKADFLKHLLLYAIVMAGHYPEHVNILQVLFKYG